MRQVHPEDPDRRRGRALRDRGAPPSLTPSYNVAPTQEVAAVVEEDGKRRLGMFRWGLIPSWAKDPAIGNKTINARAETVAHKPSFRGAFKKRRCLIGP